MNFFYEKPEHLFRHFEVGDDSLHQWARCGDIGGSPPDHFFRLGADCDDLARLLVYRDDGGLIDDDSLPPHVDERIRGSEIDSDVVGEISEESVEHSSTSIKGI